MRHQSCVSSRHVALLLTLTSCLVVSACLLFAGPAWAATGDISASPPHLVLSDGQSGQATVSWSTSGATTATVWVSSNGGPGQFFASGKSGSQKTNSSQKIVPGYTVFSLYGGSYTNTNPPPASVPPLDYTSVTTQPPPASTFGLSYWPNGRNSSTTLGPDYWPAIRPTVQRDLDQIVSMGGGLVRFMLWPSADPRVWRVGGDQRGVDDVLLQDQAANLVDLIGMCRDRGLKVNIAFGNTYLRQKDDTQYWWEWGYGSKTDDPNDTDGWDLFLADARKWVNGYVDAIEQSPVKGTVTNYEYQNELSSGNPWSYPYLRYLYDTTSIPPGKRAASVLNVSADVSPNPSPFVTGLGGRHLDYVSFHSYPAASPPLNPSIATAYNDVTSKFKDSTVFLGEFGRSTPLNADGSVDQLAEDGQRTTVTDIINQSKAKSIPYFVHWMFWDESPPSSKPTGLGYDPQWPKDAFGSVLSLTSLLRNPDMEDTVDRNGAPPGWSAKGASTVPGANLTVSLKTQGSLQDLAATNTKYAHVGVANPPGYVSLSSSPISINGGNLLSVNAYVRSNLIDLGLRVTQTLTTGTQVEATGPTFTPVGSSWNNWLHSAAPWNVCLDPRASKVAVTVRGYAGAYSPTNPYYLDVDAVAAAARPRPPSCP
jgi:hypothetical protein